MLKAIQDVNDAPLSIVFIGIGKGTDLAELAAIVQPQKGVACRDNIRYVPCEVGGDRQNLAKLALQDIPRQLEEYFLSKNIHPDPTHAKDEIDVLPYSPVTDIEVPMEINAATGEISVTDDVKPPTHDFTTKVTLAELKRLGQKINANPTFGRIKRNINAKAVRQARYKINRLVGQNIL
jgi:Copine